MSGEKRLVLVFRRDIDIKAFVTGIIHTQAILGILRVYREN